LNPRTFKAQASIRKGLWYFIAQVSVAMVTSDAADPQEHLAFQLM